jgi:hypothetical protein
MVQRCKIDTPNTQIHARLVQGFQYKVVVFMKLLMDTTTPLPLSNMMRSGKCVPHGSNMPTLTYDCMVSFFIFIMVEIVIIYLPFHELKTSH